MCPGPASNDTYAGCTAGCRYCFASAPNRNTAGARADTSASKARRAFGAPAPTIASPDAEARDLVTAGVPLHIGGMADPLQYAELLTGKTLDALRMLGEQDAPVILSTKFPQALTCGRLASAWSDLGRKLLQVSICAADDALERIEPSAPSWRERFAAIRELTPSTTVLVRIQPVLVGFTNFATLCAAAAEAGATAVTVEGFKAASKAVQDVPTMVGAKTPDTRTNGDYAYTFGQKLAYQAEARAAARQNGLRHYIADNGLRWLGDSLACCGQDLIPGATLWQAEIGHILAEAFGSGRVSFSHMQKALEGARHWRTVANTGNKAQDAVVTAQWGKGATDAATVYARRWWHKQLPQEAPFMQAVDTDPDGDPIYSPAIPPQMADFIRTNFGEEKVP